MEVSIFILFSFTKQFHFTLLGSSVGVTVTFSLTSTINAGNIDLIQISVEAFLIGSRKLCSERFFLFSYVRRGGFRIFKHQTSIQ